MSQLPARLASDYRPATSREILDWSFGRVTAARQAGATGWEQQRGTIEDQRIFGPRQDHACACGKYDGLQYHHMICDRCGVKVSSPAERSRRFAHIELTAPVPHPFADGSVRLAVFPVLPATLLESASGRRLAAVYDALVLASIDAKEDHMLMIIEQSVEILLPVLDFTHRWGLPDATTLARGLALENRAEDR